MISTVTVPKNNDLEAGDSISKIAHILCPNRIKCGFRLKSAPKCCSDDKHHNISCKRSFKGVSHYFQNWSLFGLE